MIEGDWATEATKDYNPKHLCLAFVGEDARSVTILMDGLIHSALTTRM